MLKKTIAMGQTYNVSKLVDSLLDNPLYLNRFHYFKAEDVSLTTKRNLENMEQVFKALIENGLDAQPNGKIKVYIIKKENAVIFKVVNEGHIEYGSLREKLKQEIEKGFAYFYCNQIQVLSADNWEIQNDRLATKQDLENLADEQLLFIPSLSNKNDPEIFFGGQGKGLPFVKRQVNQWGGTFSIKGKNNTVTATIIF